jgi:hypothetical protein
MVRESGPRICDNKISTGHIPAKVCQLMQSGNESLYARSSGNIRRRVHLY